MLGTEPNAFLVMLQSGMMTVLVSGRSRVERSLLRGNAPSDNPPELITAYVWAARFSETVSAGEIWPRAGRGAAAIRTQKQLTEQAQGL